MELRTLIDDFLRHISSERNLRPNTVRSYRWDAEKWMGYLQTAEIPQRTESINVDVIRAFIRHLMDNGISASTNLRKSAPSPLASEMVCGLNPGSLTLPDDLALTSTSRY